MGTPRYSKEFKAEAVRLFKAGNKPVAQLARELGVAGGTIRIWASRAEADEGNGGSGALTTPEREELLLSRKKIRELERKRAPLSYRASSKRRHTSRRRKSEISLYRNKGRPLPGRLDVSPTKSFSVGVLCLASSQAECASCLPSRMHSRLL